MKKLKLLTLITSILGALITILVLSKGSTSADGHILTAIHHLSSPTLDSFFEFATNLGDPFVLAGVAFLIICYLAIKRNFEAAGFVTVAIGGAAALNVVIKHLVARTRPALFHHLVVETNFSFPSGHAMGSAALVFTLLYLVWHQSYRNIALAVGALYLIIIGFSRLYLGVHFPTDVIGGWVLALAWVSATALALSLWRQRQTNRISPPSA